MTTPDPAGTLSEEAVRIAGHTAQNHARAISAVILLLAAAAIWLGIQLRVTDASLARHAYANCRYETASTKALTGLNTALTRLDGKELARLLATPPFVARVQGETPAHFAARVTAFRRFFAVYFADARAARLKYLNLIPATAVRCHRP